MSETAWLALVSSLLTAIGLLGGLAYKDTIRRPGRLEAQNEKLNAAVLSLIIGKIVDPNTVAASLHNRKRPILAV